MTAVEVRSDLPELQATADGLARLVRVKVGAALAEGAVRTSLRHLVAAGTIRAAAAWVEDGPTGCRITFVVEPRSRVVEVRADKVEGLSTREVRQKIEVREGQPLVADRVLRSVFAVQELLEGKGFLDATVRAQIEDRGPREVAMLLRIDPGPRYRVERVVLTGEPDGLTPDAAKGPLVIDPGDHLDRQKLADEADRLKRWLVERGRRLARVSEPEVVVDEASRRVELHYAVDAGPTVEVEVRGPDSRSRLERRGLLPLLDEDGYDEALLLRSVDLLEAYYQSRGHWKAAVETREERTDGSLVVVLEIEPGPVYTLDEVRFEGNDSVGREVIEGLMATQARQTLSRGSGRLVDRVLTEDLSNVRAYYALEGFVGTRIGPPRVTEPADGRLTLVVPVVEGVRRRVVEILFEGFAVVDPSTAEGLPLASGGPFHPRRVEELLDRLRSEYARLGYVDAQLSAEEQWNDEGTLVDIVVRVDEGLPTTVDQVIVRGLRKTSPKLVRSVADLDRGAPFAESELLRVQRNLYRLGVFSRVRVVSTAREIGSWERDVVIELEEGRTQRLSYGFGYDSEDGIGGVFGYTQSNLWGRAASFGFDARVTEGDDRFRIRLSLPVPREVGTFTWSGSIYQDVVKRPGFDIAQSGLDAGATWQRGELSWRLAYGYRFVDPIELQGIDPADLDPEFQQLEISSFSSSFAWDRRDDPIDPTTGTLSSALVQYAFPLASAEEEFFKLFLQQAVYLPLGEAGVLAASLRLGGIEPLTERPVPVAERFFAGGRTTHRAYERDRLGIPGETLDGDQPIGGTGLALVNVEYRFPISGPIGGTVFTDGGNVWADWRDLGVQDLEWGAGLGLRYLSPIGPLRAEIGWKLDPREEESGYEVFLSFGHAF